MTIIAMSNAVITYKTMNLYVAYAPESGAWSFGACLEEAVNSLTDHLNASRREVQTTGDEKNGNGLG